jgi:hypothetical protein
VRVRLLRRKEDQHQFIVIGINNDELKIFTNPSNLLEMKSDDEKLTIIMHYNLTDDLLDKEFSEMFEDVEMEIGEGVKGPPGVEPS